MNLRRDPKKRRITDYDDLELGVSLPEQNAVQDNNHINTESASHAVIQDIFEVSPRMDVPASLNVSYERGVFRTSVFY